MFVPFRDKIFISDEKERGYFNYYEVVEKNKIKTKIAFGKRK